MCARVSREYNNNIYSIYMYIKSLNPPCVLLFKSKYFGCGVCVIFIFLSLSFGRTEFNCLEILFFSMGFFSIYFMLLCAALCAIISFSMLPRALINVTIIWKMESKQCKQQPKKVPAMELMKIEKKIPNPFEMRAET